MALPPALHYRLVRLKVISRPLRRPVVWGTLAALGLGAVVVVPQYLRHPEWRSQYDAAIDSPAVNPGTDLSALTHEDLADLAEIDNLGLLLNQLQPTTAGALEDLPAIESSRFALPQTTPAEATASPFAQYLERNRFRFSPTPNGAADAGEPAIALENPVLTIAPGQRQTSGARFSGAASAEALPPSPLQQALGERLNSRPVPSSAAPAAATGAAASSTEPPTSGLTPSTIQEEGRLPGVNQRFMRTTPPMSPPPGTTGYTQPPQVRLPSPAVPIPQQGAIAPAPLNLDFGSPVTTPTGNGQGRFRNGSLHETQPDALGNSLSAPSPFSAPRPPDVYTGNGYINTFSDPSGLPAY